MPRKRSQSAKETKGDPAAAAKAADALFETRAWNKPSVPMPALKPGFDRVVARVFDLDDPDGEFQAILTQLTVEEAITPEKVEMALNHAEDTARKAHRLYIVARVDNDRYEVECSAVMGALRDAATAELQAEKEAGERSKAITEADVSGRVATMFPDEWTEINDRRAKAKGMLDHVKRIADLWEGRCYTLSTMAGRKRKRSF